MESTQLIQMLREITIPRRVEGLEMEFGKQEVEEGGMGLDAIQVQDNGRIPMPINFGSMREFLEALDEAIPHNGFLRNWLRGKVQREQGGFRDKMGPRGRAGYRGRGGQRCKGR